MTTKKQTPKKTKPTVKKLAVFDIDGTIFRKNLHFELINQLAWLKVFPNEVRHRLTEAYSSWIEHEGTYEDYRRALVDLYALHIKGCKVEDVAKAAQMVVPFHAKRTYVFSEALIKRLRQEGYHLLVISGSPLEIVEEYNKQYLKFDGVYGSVYETDEEGVYTGRAIFEPSRMKDKVVEKYIEEHDLSLDDSYGIGDTESDGGFLRLVQNPIAFNPNQNLKSMAEEAGWKIVVEKKDVIYELN